MKLLAVLVCVAGLAFASGTLSGEAGGFGGGATAPQTDDELDTYAYNQSEQMSSIGASFGSYATIDDFTYGPTDVSIETFTCWGVTTASTPTELELYVVADNNGVPEGDPVQQPSVSLTCDDTGFTYGSYTVWLAVMDFTGSPVAVTTPVWLGSHRAGGSSDTWYPVGGTTITGSEGYRIESAGGSWVPFSSTSIGEGDLFKTIDGTASFLSRNTWAGIKSNF
ncbi:hypothetical protein CSA37_01785 [Candidatus Fermentibacteria bacterium]|nr:MAG: hypothetical protein CSA37_01785 [Candidatus Fermentibacteria bacterium]